VKKGRLKRDQLGERAWVQIRVNGKNSDKDQGDFNLVLNKVLWRSLEKQMPMKRQVGFMGLELSQGVVGIGLLIMHNSQLADFSTHAKGPNEAVHLVGIEVFTFDQGVGLEMGFEPSLFSPDPLTLRLGLGFGPGK
jgi:hypothetical protein